MNFKICMKETRGSVIENRGVWNILVQKSVLGQLTQLRMYVKTNRKIC